MIKRILNKAVVIAAAFFMLTACNKTEEAERIVGPTMGTTYHITYYDSLHRNLKPGVDSVLKDLNLSLSTYIDSSLISEFNQSNSGVMSDEHFRDVYLRSLEIAKNTRGHFDPTVAPLINAWGFGFENRKNVDSALVDSLMDFVGYKNVSMNGDSIIKNLKGVELNFSAIAKGYGVDEVGLYLESKGIKNYLVEIGGEIRTSGNKPEGSDWILAIEKPEDKQGSTQGSGGMQAKLSLNGQSMATSGNYRNYYVKDGIKYAHTINPHTGWPVNHSLLSATVVADDCMTADAYATAFMVMGKKESLELLNKLNEKIEVYFIYSDDEGNLKTFMSESLKNRIEEVES